ncbi:MAG: protein disulfide oxidoreductase [Candidatus Thiothrix sulfatifontis]|nr:MAG: protein disulfide oxidoreductase [Candidatus Thiothrix sulfatifontis]
MSTHTSNHDDQPPKKRRWPRWLLEALIILAIIFGVRTWQQRGMLDGEAPDFERTALNGDVIHLDNYRGKPVLLHFWASWCPMCELEQGSISGIAKDWKVITIAFQSGGAEEVQRYMEREKITEWVTIVDEDGSLSGQYGIKGVPTSYVLDEEGIIRFREVGLTSGWGLRLRLWMADWLV